MKKITYNKIIGIIFIVITFMFAIINIKSLINICESKKSDINKDSLQKITASIQDSYKGSFSEKRSLIDLYGLVQDSIGKRIIGNYEYIKDNDGFIHMFQSDKSQTDINNFCNDLNKLKNELQKQNIPLLYVQNPTREIIGYTSIPYSLNINGNITIDKIISQLKIDGIDYMDVRDIIREQKYPVSSIFYKTDVHPTVEAQIWIANKIVDRFETSYNFNFPNKDTVFNLNNYNKITKDFLGNLAQSAGQYFTGNDKFNMYIPKYGTDFILTNKSSNIVKKGSFEDVIMNGNEFNSTSNLTYWVINYLQWPSPYYTIENNNVKDLNLLVIMDSTALDTASYLSLLASKITVVDPRYIGNFDYIDSAINSNHFNAAIVIQGDSTTLLGYRFFPDINGNSN